MIEFTMKNATDWNKDYPNVPESWIKRIQADARLEEAKANRYKCQRMGTRADTQYDHVWAADSMLESVKFWQRQAEMESPTFLPPLIESEPTAPNP